MSIRVKMDVIMVALDRSNFWNHTNEQLFKGIAKVEGTSDISHMKAYQVLTSDKSAIRAFLACLINWHKLCY